MSFEGIIGNEENKSILENSVKTGKILHSYLFHGVNGIGKKLFALNFAKMILCNDSNDAPCDECNSCKTFDTNNNPDFFLIEPDGNSIKIDQVREFEKSVQEKPIESQKKVYIFDGADTMTKEAQNCLLKTLEEPQEYIVIILIASNEGSILPTIKSRCTKIYFRGIKKNDIKKYIQDKYPSNTVDESMYDLCNGSISLAENIVQKSEILNTAMDIIMSIEKTNELAFFENNQFLIEYKDDINLILDCMYIALYKNIKNNIGQNEMAYYNSMKIIEHTKNKLSNSNNFDMTIDGMLIGIWEEFNEKNSWG